MTNRTRRPFALDEAVALLARTPAILAAQLRELPEAWVHAHEGGASWSPFEVVGHLILAERTNWVPRATTIVEQGEAKTFDEFTRYPEFAHAERRTLASLLDEFASAREESLRRLQTMRSGDLNRRGRHPAFGVVTMRQLLSAWVVHDLDHLAQISRVLAYQYVEEVGPWREYLRIVREEPR